MAFFGLIGQSLHNYVNWIT